MVNVAVIGIGWWGQTIIDVLATSATLKVVKGVKRNPASVSEFAASRGVEVISDYGTVLRDPNVHAVILCTPHSQHTEQIIAAARAGKHVFCEKPLTLTRADAVRAATEIEAAQRVLAVGHERRFEPPILELMRAIRAGELGTPLQVEGNFSQDKFLAMAADNWRLSPAEAPAGPLTATGIHVLDLAIGVFGEAESVCASVKQLGSHLRNGDTLAALVAFKRGGHALITAILATPFDGRFAVYGSKGWIEVRDKAHPSAPQGWTLTKVLSGERRSTTEFPPVSGVAANLEAFAAAVEGRSPYPVSHAEMIANIAALEAVVESARTGAKVSVA
ncbi:MAG: Gfo/Idh/MocA family oxidoreductase [Burkholderiales bacterium]|nr:Gfo/Idh/MocA family oxidoreductase [Burkholderiales bacterium]